MRAEVIGVDREKDLGLLRVRGKNLPDTLKIGSIDGLAETQELFVFGFPFGTRLARTNTFLATDEK